jgi:uncharacterized protein YbjT (DUF2867 family)
MILVVGGTGRLGSSVVATLLADGHEVRVLARGRRPPPAGITGAQWIPGSVTDSGVVARAVHGVAVVITAFTGFPSTSPARVDNEGTGAVVRAARRVGARMVFLSVAGAAADAPLELFRAKYAAESAVKSSDLEWTIIRPDAFADLWIELLTQSARRTHRPLVFGRGDNPTGWVAVRDVTSLTVRAAQTTTLCGRSLTISGPQRLTLTELASHVMAAQHWPGTPRYVPTAMLRAASMLPGAPGRQAQAALAMETLPPVVDDARRAVPQLPCTTVDALLTTAPAEPV